jgi:deoxycytidylate deaminase
VIDTVRTTPQSTQDAGGKHTLTGMNEPLRRLVKLLTSTQIVRATVSETAMHHAHSAQLRSACLSRQVGAALVDGKGNIIATGTNEVPKAGGGVYGESFDVGRAPDDRCAFRETKFCSSNREQNAIIESLLEEFPALAEGRQKSEIYLVDIAFVDQGYIGAKPAAAAKVHGIAGC